MRKLQINQQFFYQQYLVIGEFSCFTLFFERFTCEQEANRKHPPVIKA